MQLWIHHIQINAWIYGKNWRKKIVIENYASLSILIYFSFYPAGMMEKGGNRKIRFIRNYISYLKFPLARIQLAYSSTNWEIFFQNNSFTPLFISAYMRQHHRFIIKWEKRRSKYLDQRLFQLTREGVNLQPYYMCAKRLMTIAFIIIITSLCKWNK